MHPQQSKNSDAYLDVRKTVRTIARKWHWYLAAIIISFAGALIFNKLATPKYLVSASIYIKETGSPATEKAQEFMQNFMLFNQQRTYQNEMLVIGSSPLIKQAIQQLNMAVSYFQKEGFAYYEKYNLAPFRVVFDSLHSQPLNTDFNIEFLEDGQFTLKAKQKNITAYDYVNQKKIRTNDDIAIQQSGLPGEIIEGVHHRFRILITKAEALPWIAGKKFRFRFNDMKQLERQISEALTIEPANPEVSIVNISMKWPSAEQAVDFIDILTGIYLQKNLARKNHLANNTLKYISEQLSQIQDSLSFAEKKLERFRSSRQIMDIGNKTTRVLDRLQQLEVERTNLEREYKYYQYLETYFNNNTDLSDLVVPSSMGIADKTLNELIRDLILLVNQRNELIARKQQKSPYLKNLEIQIENLKKPILENIRFAVSTLGKNVGDIEQTIAKLKAEAGQLPETERQLIGFERKFQLNDGIYTYLLERQAEAQIAKSSNLPEHEMVEPARFMDIIFPNSRINYSLAIFLALMLPTLLIFGIDFFDDRIKSEDDLKDYFKIPMAGHVTKSENAPAMTGQSQPNPLLAESFRTIRTNLSFFAKGNPLQTILVTSAISGEGKSFVARHLAAAYAQMGRKTILLGFDLRKGEQFKEVQHTEARTLSAFYLNQSNIEDIIVPLEQPNLFVIPTGVVPPNPLELITSEQTRQLLARLKEDFDHIIIDTPPVGIVSDAFLLMHYAQVNLIVTREKLSRKRIIQSILDDMADKQIGNLAFILNASSLANKKYQYKYYHPKKV
ncbi:MAG: GumC family protein [Breznakibacter sp.]